MKTASNLTRQLLTFSRQQPLRFQSIDLNEVVVGMVKMLRQLIPEAVTIQTRLLPESMLIQADRGLVEQVLLNLAVNARDAMTNGGEITLTLKAVKIWLGFRQYQPPSLLRRRFKIHGLRNL